MAVYSAKGFYHVAVMRRQFAFLRLHTELVEIEDDDGAEWLDVAGELREQHEMEMVGMDKMESIIEDDAQEELEHTRRELEGLEHAREIEKQEMAQEITAIGEILAHRNS